MSDCLTGRTDALNQIDMFWKAELKLEQTKDKSKNKSKQSHKNCEIVRICLFTKFVNLSVTFFQRPRSKYSAYLFKYHMVFLKFSDQKKQMTTGYVMDVSRALLIVKEADFN